MLWCYSYAGSATNFRQSNNYTCIQVDRRIYLKFKYHLIFPDGKDGNPFMVIGVDDGSGKGYQTPGPTLTLVEGENVEIIVTNLLPDSLSLHLHGFLHHGTMFSDGVPGITQFAVPSRSSYIYRFKAEIPGTFWYHGHFGPNIIDQMYGGLNVIEKNSTNPFKGNYTSDETILFGGVPPTPATGGILYTMFTFRPNGAEKPTFLSDTLFVVNGKSSKNPFILSIKSGETKRLRFVNTNHEEEVYFTIQGHNYTIISLDSGYIVPILKQSGEYTILYNAQRADILLTGLSNQSDNYKINVLYNGENGNAENTFAILNYEGVDPSKSPVSFDIPTDPLPSDFLPTPFPNEVEPSVNKIPFGAERIVTLKQHSFFCNDTSFRNISVADQSFQISIDGSPYYPFEYPSIPTIFDYRFTNVNRIDVNLGQTVDFIFYNYDIDPHPLHIHGHRTFLLGRGIGEFDFEKDVATLNLENPLSRDVIHLGPGIECGVEDNGIGECTNDPTICGDEIACNKLSKFIGGKQPSWTAMRITFDHIGPFIAHCHIASHFQLGFAFVIIVDANTPYPLPNYIPYSFFNVSVQR